MIDGRRVVALLPVGGAGSRLWPLSADALPKPFLKLLGPHSLYQMTLARLAAAAVDEVVVIANATLEPLVRDQAAEIGRPLPALLLEPFARDSGPPSPPALRRCCKRIRPTRSSSRRRAIT